MDGPPGLHLIVEEGSINSLSRLSSACFFLFVHSGRGRQPTYMKRKRGGVPCLSVEEGNKQVEATDALVIRLLDASLCLLSCWQKRGFRPVLPTIGFEPMTLAV